MSLRGAESPGGEQARSSSRRACSDVGQPLGLELVEMQCLANAKSLSRVMAARAWPPLSSPTARGHVSGGRQVDSQGSR